MNLKRFLLGCTAVAVFLSGMLAAQTNCNAGAGPLDAREPEGVSVQEIIRRFVANESKFKAARAGYSYTQDIKIQTLRPMGPTQVVVDGEYRQIAEVAYDERGRRSERVTFAPQSTLRRISLGPEDMEDIPAHMGFVLTTQTLPQYSVHYAGRQHVDELDTYVFEVAPTAIEKNRHYFQGRVWVDKGDLAVVKTCGKTIPDAPVTKGKRGGTVESVHATFATYRERIDGNWFPTYARSDDYLYFSRQGVRIRETIKTSEWKRQGTTQRVVAQ